jgi:hypothetical protein
VSLQPFAELICAYLDGMPGAADVLNDALEESSRPRVVVDGTLGERLALVLEELLSEPVARRVAVDFAKHVASLCENPLAQEVIDRKSNQVDGIAPAETQSSHVLEADEERPHDLLERGLLLRLGWNEENTPQASAAWALWGALQIPVRYVAQAAQRANTTELNWQVEHLKRILSGPP